MNGSFTFVHALLHQYLDKGTFTRSLGLALHPPTGLLINTFSTCIMYPFKILVGELFASRNTSLTLFVRTEIKQNQLDLNLCVSKTWHIILMSAFTSTVYLARWDGPFYKALFPH